jgi:hypothetical protein
MSKIIVTLLGIGAIVWVNYYFFFAGSGRKKEGIGRVSP